jgi:uncharacterized membrane protein
MKKALVAAGLIAIVGLMGCKKSEEGGGAGANTFKLTVPLTSTAVKQGETQVLRVAVERGEAFKESVKLEVKAPKGLSVDPDSTTVKPGDKGDVQLTIKADKDAPLGDQVVQIKGKPDKGEPTTTTFTITVSAK